MRAVVTGIGTVSPLGVGKEALLAALRSGTGTGTGTYGIHVAGFDPREFVAPMVLRRLDRSGALAVAAGTLAARDAGLDVKAAPERVGIVVGTGGAGIDTTGAFFRVICAQGPAAANPMLFPNTVTNAPAGQLAIALGASGPSTTFAEKAMAGENAIAFGAELVLSGRADAVLAGGVDELSEYLHHAYVRYGALSKAGAARPFDARRDGLLLGEGAAFLVLETEERARARGARIYAALAGFAQTSAATGLTEYPRTPASFARNLAATLERAGVRADEIGWINASANGTRALDALEAAALGAALGPALSRIPVSSLKGATGDAMAGGGLRAAASCLAIAESFVPATAGLEKLDPALADAAGGRLDAVLGAARDTTIGTVLQTGIGEGGSSLSLMFSRM